MNPTLAELVHQPGVDRAEEQVAVLRALTRTGNVLQDPAHLRRREVRVDDKTGFLAKGVREALLLELIRIVGGAAALPDDGVVHRLTGHAIPDDGRLTLVGDADRGDLVIAHAELPHRLTRDGKLALPDLVRVVLDPARLGEILGEFLLRHRADHALAVEEDTAVRGRARVERHDVLLHILPPFLPVGDDARDVPIVSSHSYSYYTIFAPSFSILNNDKNSQRFMYNMPCLMRN